MVWILIVCLFIAYSAIVLTHAWKQRALAEQSLRYVEVDGRPILDVFPNLVSKEVMVVVMMMMMMMMIIMLVRRGGGGMVVVVVGMIIV